MSCGALDLCLFIHVSLPFFPACTCICSPCSNNMIWVWIWFFIIIIFSPCLKALSRKPMCQKELNAVVLTVWCLESAKQSIHEEQLRASHGAARHETSAMVKATSASQYKRPQGRQTVGGSEPLNLSLLLPSPGLGGRSRFTALNMRTKHSKTWSSSLRLLFLGMVSAHSHRKSRFHHVVGAGGRFKVSQASANTFNGAHPPNIDLEAAGIRRGWISAGLCYSLHAL